MQLPTFKRVDVVSNIAVKESDPNSIMAGRTGVMAAAIISTVSHISLRCDKSKF